jgi:cell filamentation protein
LTGTNVLRNLYGVRDADTLQKLESRLTNVRLIELSSHTVKTSNDLEGLKAIHDYIFQDVYSWAGHVRRVPLHKPEEALGGGSVAYSQPREIVKEASEAFKNLNSRTWSTMSLDERAVTLSKDIAELWQVHAFREGNTRTVVTFMDKFTREHDMRLDLALLGENAAYVRRSLVAASEDKPEYLSRIVKDALERGALLKEEPRPVLDLDAGRGRGGLDLDR